MLNYTLEHWKHAALRFMSISALVSGRINVSGIRDVGWNSVV